MKKAIALFLSSLMIFTVTACGNENSGSNAASQPGNENAQEQTRGSAGVSVEATEETFSETSAGTLAEETTEAPTEEAAGTPTETPAEDPETTEGKTLVVYFSATGNTEEAANYIAAATGADMLELVPVEPYSDDDLDWTDDSSRVVYEYENPDAREVELVETTVADWEAYDTVFIGYPIWWGIAAWPVDSFIAANDFTGKTVIPFCTSASSGLGESGELLAEAAGTGNWMEGMRFSSAVSESDVRTWLEDMGL